MWTGRDHKFGGLKHRYTKRPRADSRSFDPLRLEHVSFPTELKYENWLLHWADPGITKLVCTSERLRCLDHGRSVSIVPDLVVVRGDVQLQCVVLLMDATAVHTGKSLELVAQAYGCSWALRTRDQIRANPLLLENLERLRQSAMVCVDEPLDALRSEIETVLPDNAPLSIRDLRQALNFPETDSRFDAALIHMHWTGHVHINLEEFRYDDATVSRNTPRTR